MFFIKLTGLGGQECYINPLKCECFSATDSGGTRIDLAADGFLCVKEDPVTVNNEIFYMVQNVSQEMANQIAGRLGR